MPPVQDAPRSPGRPKPKHVLTLEVTLEATYVCGGIETTAHLPPIGRCSCELYSHVGPVELIVSLWQAHARHPSARTEETITP